MRYLLHIFLTLIIIGLAAWLYYIISEPVRVTHRLEHIDARVKERMDYIAAAEIAYKSAHGKYTDNWYFLVDFAKNGKLPVVKSTTSTDTSYVSVTDTTFISARDSLFPAGYAIDSLPFVPYAKDGLRFVIELSVVETGSNSVPVFQITDTRPPHLRMRDPYTWGSLSEVKYGGSWE
ncbi:MAG: hypothetical protein M3Q97_09995 [Bacteroidota bacterium]|nr:hypothetical protein [Bacteroidota bacterium]